jgi:hypothetical protein
VTARKPYDTELSFGTSDETQAPKRPPYEVSQKVGPPLPGDRSADSDFARFEDLARKLTRVPKSEVDEKRKAT